MAYVDMAKVVEAYLTDKITAEQYVALIPANGAGIKATAIINREIKEFFQAIYYGLKNFLRLNKLF